MRWMKWSTGVNLSVIPIPHPALTGHALLLQRLA
jgi:hypothetical protein